VCGSKGTQTTSSTFSPPPAVQANYDYLTDLAKSTAATPFQQYQGEMVAGLTPTQEAGIQNVNASAGLAQPYYQAATGYAQQAATPFGQQQLNQYMSPYINDVVAQTMANLGETNAQQQQSLLGNAIQKGAFGGDRAGIAQAELIRQQNLATGQTLANVLQGGYGQALGQFNADQNRSLQTGSTLGTLGTGAQTAGIQGGQAQLGAGAQQQAIQQAQDVANQQQFQAAQAYPFQTTQYLGNLLLGIGGQSGGTALTSQPQGNLGTSLVGGLLSAGQVFGPAMMASDERVKENIEPVGKTFDGQNIYKYNYKGSPTTNIGLIAQEVEKRHPSAVYKTENGMRMVDYDQATGGAAEKGHFARGGVADSMGGAVHEGLGRAAFALDGGVDYHPYSEQPSGGSTKPLTLAEVMRVPAKVIKPIGGKTNMPSPPDAAKEGETMMDVAKQLANASPEAKANLRGNVAAIKSSLGLGTVLPADVLGQGQGSYSLGLHFSDGGGVGRHGYAEDGAVQPNQTTAPQGRTLAEAIVGHPLSEEANMGVLAAGLGMLSNKSPIFGIGVGEGATAGLGTYYNALANKRAYEKQQRELELTQQERNTQQQMADIAKGKSPSEIALANANAVEALQRAKTGSNASYVKTWITGKGYVVNDLNRPYAGPIQITDADLNPVGNIDPDTIPTDPNSPPPPTKKGAAVKVPEVPKTSGSPPDVVPKQKEESTTNEWQPITTVPTGFNYPGSMNLALTPGALEKAQASAEKIKADQDAKAQGAFDTLYSLDNMDRSFNDLSKTGLLAPGQHVDERTNFAVGVNTMASILGGKPIFDPTDVAALEELAKDNKRLGFALSKTMGREPGFIVQQAISANPSAANTPLGFHRITEALRQAAQYEQDRNAFYDSYKAKFGHLEGANDLFTKLNPPSQYANRAIVNSIDPTHLSEIRQWAEANKGKDISAGRAQFDKIYGTNAFKLATGQ